jgi:hypothetical protein
VNIKHGVRILALAIVMIIAGRAMGASARTKPNPKPSEPEQWFLFVTSDAGAEVKSATVTSARKQLAELRARHTTAFKEQATLANRWRTARNNEPFPVPMVSEPSCRRLAAVPKDAKQREAMLARYQKALDRWDVLVLKDHLGKVTTEVIRRDRVQSRKQKLYLAYVNAVLGSEKGPATKAVAVLPQFKIAHSNITPRDAADRLSDALVKQQETRPPFPDTSKPKALQPAPLKPPPSVDLDTNGELP